MTSTTMNKPFHQMYDGSNAYSSSLSTYYQAPVPLPSPMILDKQAPTCASPGFRHVADSSAMNYLGIQLNNYAVAALKQGDVVKAFELLSYACEKAMQKHYSPHTNTAHKTYRYAWEDCTLALTKKLHRLSKYNEGSMSFLYLKFLTIETPLGKASIEGLCPCGFSWVLWYNLAIVSALLGNPVSKPGNLLLQQSLHLFERVQARVDAEPISSKHWSMLQLSILNNQACVLSDLSRSDDTLQCLVRMGLTLTKTYNILDPTDQELFHWTAKTLVDDTFAVAA